MDYTCFLTIESVLSFPVLKFVIVTGLTTVPFGDKNQTSCVLYFSYSTS